MDAQLAAIQNDLFDLGADLCRPDMEKDAEAEYQPLRMTPAQVARLEAEIDAMNDALEPLRSFILPGGSALASQLHLCRTVSRRAERMTVELAGQEAINASALQYLNRLSDWFFVAGRFANDDWRADILWIPGANRLDPKVTACNTLETSNRNLAAAMRRNVDFPLFPKEKRR